MSESEVGEAPPAGTGRKALVATREVAFVLIGALIISSLIRSFLGQAFEIPSGSMENTLLIGDKVVVAKAADYQRGDVVVFEDPGGWLGEAADAGDVGPLRHALEFVGVLPNSSKQHLIKRVIGTPGDRVKCCDAKGRLSVNGQPLDETSYLFIDEESGEQSKPSDFDFEVVVPAGTLFMMGDHRDNSRDSRCHLGEISTDGRPTGASAFVPVDKAVGPAVVIMAPISRWRHLTVPATFAAVPAPREPAPAQASIKTDNGSC